MDYRRWGRIALLMRVCGSFSLGLRCKIHVPFSFPFFFFFFFFLALAALLMWFHTSEAVSKVVIPATPAFSGRDTRNHRYLFVDLPSAEEARRAVKATDGRYAWGVKLKVRVAHGADSGKTRERGEWDESGMALQPA